MPNDAPGPSLAVPANRRPALFGLAKCSSSRLQQLPVLLEQGVHPRHHGGHLIQPAVLTVAIGGRVLRGADFRAGLADGLPGRAPGIS
jgi:hypothetical protein